MGLDQEQVGNAVHTRIIIVLVKKDVCGSNLPTRLSLPVEASRVIEGRLSGSRLCAVAFSADHENADDLKRGNENVEAG